MSRYEEQLAMMRRIHPRLPLREDQEQAFVDGWLQSAAGSGLRSVLDAGCGFQHGLVVQYRDRVRAIGIDIDLETVRRNRDLDARAVANCESMPFRRGSVDLIFCRDVLEHLRVPGAAIREFGRVLAPGGALVLSTVNVRNPGMWSVRFVPQWLRTVVRAASFGPELGENAPTFYRANTRAQIRTLLEQEGFVISSCHYYPTFAWYFRFANPLLILFTSINQLLDRLGLSRYYGGILVVASKPAGSEGS
jgi:SAM-dependent methyltransferase